VTDDRIYAASQEIEPYTPPGELDDLFDAVAEKYEVRAGRYRFPPPPGVEPSPNGWMRATNLAGAFSDQRALQLWLERMTLLGLIANDGLIFDELCALHEPSEEDLKQIGERARSAAGADAGARRGTARHLMMSGYLDHGLINGHRTMKLQMSSLLEAMEAHELDFLPGWQERVVWHPAAGGTCGRLVARVMCRRTGRVGVRDLKTQRRFWTYQEICGQQYLYDSAPWVWEGSEDALGRWVPYSCVRTTGGPPWDENTLLGHPDGDLPGKRVALLAHMPQQPGPEQLPVQIHEVDLEYGREVIETAERNVELRSRGKSVASGRKVGALRPLTSSVAQV
jgi:hypothetical protein